MVDRRVVEQEMRARISAFSHLPEAQRQAMVDEEVKQREGTAGRPTHFRLYQRHMLDPESQQFFDEQPTSGKNSPKSDAEQKLLETSSFPQRSRVRRIGDLPSEAQDVQQPIPPNQRPNARPAATDITLLPQLSEDEAREKLTQAIAQRDETRERFEFAQRRLASAVDAHENAQLESAGFMSLNSRIFEHDAEAFVHGADPLATLPAHLQQARHDSVLAHDKLQRASALRQRIEAELEQVQQELDESNAIVSLAGAAVAIALARNLSLKLDDLELDAHALRCRIVSLQIAGTSVPDCLVRRCFQPPKPVQGDADAKVQWRSLLERLRHDANADLD